MPEEARAEEPEVSAPEMKEVPKRGRGRPPKQAAATQAEDGDGVEAMPKRGRGRPRKDQPEQQVAAAPKERESLTAPPHTAIGKSEEASAAEKMVADLVHFGTKRTRDGAEWVVFTYLKPWGPGTKLNLSAYYPNKLLATGAILKWAGEYWSERVKVSTMGQKALAVRSSSSTSQFPYLAEDRVTSGVRDFRSAYVKMLTKTLTPEAIMQDETQEVLRVVEDDGLSMKLQEVSRNQEALPEAFEETLEGAIKTETDKWKEPAQVVWMGPFGIEKTLEAMGQKAQVPSVLLDTLKDMEELPHNFALVYDNGHFVPFWKKTAHGPYQSRPWLPRESYEGFSRFQEAADRLNCHADLT